MYDNGSNNTMSFNLSFFLFKGLMCKILDLDLDIINHIEFNQKKMMAEGFEPSPLRTSALSWRLRPLGHTTFVVIQHNRSTFIQVIQRLLKFNFKTFTHLHSQFPQVPELPWRRKFICLVFQLSTRFKHLILITRSPTSFRAFHPELSLESLQFQEGLTLR